MKKLYLNYLTLLLAISSFALVNAQTCTTPGASTTVIFLEEFDNNSAGWTGDIGNANQDWEIPDASGSSNTGASNAYSGSNFMNYEASYTYTPDQGSIVSPAIDLTGAIDAAELSFWMHAYGSNMGTFDLAVGTSASGPFTNEYTHSGQIQTTGTQAWVNVTVDLTGYLGSTIYIELTQTDLSGYYGDMSIDAFQVSGCFGVVTCARPTTLSSSSITTNGADLAWVNPSGATSWEVSYGASGFTAGMGTELVVGTNPYSLTGLSSATSYDCYVRAICAPGDTSLWSVVNSFTTLISCPEPTTLTSASLTSDGASLTWANPSGATSWEVSYGASGFTAGMGMEIVVATNPYSLTGLSSNTAYDCYVRAICAPGDTSTWSTVNSFTTLVSCPEPTTLSVGSLVATGASLTWANPSGATSWEISYGAPGFTAGAGTELIVGSNPYNLTGLSTTTSYDWYVRAICGPGDESVWSAVNSFTTPLTALSCTGTATFAPFFSTSFESASCTSGSNFNNFLGWTSKNGNYGSWKIECSGATPSSWVDAGAYDGNDYAYFESSYAQNANTTDTILTEDFDISSFSGAARATGYYLNGGASTFIVERSLDAGATWTNVLTNVGPGGNQNPDLGVWTLFVDDFSSATGSASTITWRFIGVSTNSNNLGDIGLDLFTIEACQSCFTPTALGVGAITTTSAVVNWTNPNAGVSTFDVAFGVAPFTNPGTPNAGYDDVANGVTLMGLSAATDYEYYVRADCDAAVGTDESSWEGPFAFSTPCATYVAPYHQNFDAYTLTQGVTPVTDLPVCWEDQSSQADKWAITDDNYNNPGYLPDYGDHTSGSGNYMWIDASGTPNIAGNQMVSPSIDISGLTTPYAGFWFASNRAGSNQHAISFDVWDGSAWVNLTSLSGSFTGWVEITSELPSGIPSITKFRIQAINNGSASYFNDLGVDDFFVIEKPVNTWTGALGTDWSTAGNWSFGTVPTNADQVVIPDVSAMSGNFPITAADITVSDLTVDVNASLNIGASFGLILDANGMVTNNGTLVLNADVTGAAYLDDFTNASTSYTGTLTVQQYVTPGSGVGQRMFGSPVNNGVVTGLSQTYASGSTGQIVMSNCASLSVDVGSPYNNLFEWHEDVSSPNACSFEAWFARNQSSSLENGRGYSGWMQDGTVFSFSGMPNTGNMSYGGALSNTNTGLVNKDGWHVLSNPYPSPANVNDLTLNGWSSLQTYDPGQAYGGTFQPITAGQDLAVAQGFVAFTNVNNNTANFSNAMRSANSTGFQKTINWFISKLNIEVEGNGFKDISYIYFNDDATVGFDNQWDCKKKASDAGQPTLFTKISGEKTSLNGQSIDELGNNSIPLGIAPGANGQFTFAISGLNSFPASTLIYLEDKATGVLIDLKQTNTYSFNMTEIENEDRFEVHFTKPVVFSNEAETCQGNDGFIAVDFGNQTIAGNTVVWDYELMLNSQSVENASNAQVVEFSALEPGDYEVIYSNGGTQLIEFITIEEKVQVEALFTASAITLFAGEEWNAVNNSLGATNYVWEVNGETFNSADVDYTFTNAGNYVVSLHALNEDCDAFYTETITVANKTTSISTINELENAIVYPNGKTITIDLSNVTLEGKTAVEVYNLVGLLMLNKLNVTDFEILEMNQAASGVYIVKIVNQTKSISKKVILK